VSSCGAFVTEVRVRAVTIPPLSSRSAMSSETAPRRSTRLKTKNVAIDSEDVTETALQDDGDFVEPARKKKKASRSKKAGGDEADGSSAVQEANAQPVQKRKAGKLAMLPAMPLDVLYEVRHRSPSLKVMCSTPTDLPQPPAI
jgi:hypothetical protein